ncbi:MAG: energy transducer TonB [Acidobacteriota bacterium]|nr:energy transducer TonB [Acidobacteriota bacterium]
MKYFGTKYPPAALATITTGEVVVAVKIDKKGKVTKTESVGGHPLLRASGETAARKWVFSADESNEEREVKITFAFQIKNNTSAKNNYRATRVKTKFKKPYRLEIKALAYPRIDY